MDQVVLCGINGHVAEVVFVGEENPGISVIPSLAGPPVARPLVKLVVTLAGKPTRTVTASLAAGSFGRHIDAFVDVHACSSVLHQLVSRVARALEGILCVRALVLALVVLNF
jgi:hypothetical protein